MSRVTDPDTRSVSSPGHAATVAERVARSQVALAIKRALDIVVSALALIVLSPLFAVVALLIKLDSPGPVIHRRRVVGLNGREFDAFKFRTMVGNADEVLRRNPELVREFQKNFKLRNDPRVTRVGGFLRKATIDEFPQLLNVLRGQMSLVGPRMISPVELSKYGERARKLLSVKPGMTGLWVVSGRQEIPYEQRILLEMQYIDDRSLWLDIKILLKTIPAVFIKRMGAY